MTTPEQDPTRQSATEPDTHSGEVEQFLENNLYITYSYALKSGIDPSQYFTAEQIALCETERAHQDTVEDTSPGPDELNPLAYWIPACGITPEQTVIEGVVAVFRKHVNDFSEGADD